MKIDRLVQHGEQTTTMSSEANEDGNYETFRDCLGDALIQNLASSEPKVKVKKGTGRKRRTSLDKKEDGGSVKRSENTTSSDAEDLGEFIEVCKLYLLTIILALGIHG